jgi:hypothetical protein
MIAVIIRETYQHPSQEGQLSFPSRGMGSLKPYVSDKILSHQIKYDESAVEPDYLTTDEDEEEPLSGESLGGDNDDEE